MADQTIGGAAGAGTSALDAQAARLLQQVRTAASAASPAGETPSREDAKIEKSSRDFESILLGSWLQQAEQSFATVPGGEEGDDETGKDQFQGIAMQSLAGSLTASGGIGIAKMIAEHLHKAAGRDKAAAEGAPGAGGTARPSPPA